MTIFLGLGRTAGSLPHAAESLSLTRHEARPLRSLRGGRATVRDGAGGQSISQCVQS